MLSRPRLGLALGGGAARGLAHLGVFHALEEAGMRPQVLTGTSVGALLGALYAFHQDAGEVERRVLAFTASDDFRRGALDNLRQGDQRGERGIIQNLFSLLRRGIILGVSLTRASVGSADNLARNIAALVPDVDIEDLSLPFAACSLDLIGGEAVTFTRGNLREAVRASSAIPGVFPPVERDGRLLADGGWVDKVPALPAFDLGADVVVGVDVSTVLEPPSPLRRGYDVMSRATVCIEWALRQLQLGLCDLVIRPAVSGVHWADFDQGPQLVAKGREATEAAIPLLVRQLRRERRWGWLRPSPGVRRAREHRRRVPRVEARGTA
jgi:NTE family protein